VFYFDAVASISAIEIDGSVRGLLELWPDRDVLGMIWADHLVSVDTTTFSLHDHENYGQNGLIKSTYTTACFRLLKTGICGLSEQVWACTRENLNLSS